MYVLFKIKICMFCLEQMNMMLLSLGKPQDMQTGNWRYSILLMLSHGLVSLDLFLCVGILYDRHKTRLVRYYGGLVSTMPLLQKR